MKRDVEIEFSRWKERKDRKPLVLMGARQVGKTWLMGDFGRKNFRKVHSFDFVAMPDLATIFKATKNPDELLSKLEIISGSKIDRRYDVLVLDEPIAGLDPAGCRSLLHNIKEYHHSTGSTVILVTHDMDVAASEAERLIVMKSGTVALSGTPEEIFSRPEELRSMGLDIPEAASLAQALREKGVDLPESIYTPRYLARTLLSRIGGATC